MKTTSKIVASANTLTVLRDTLNAYEPSTPDEKLTDVVDMANLPNFGGVSPANTIDVWSWDSENVLLNDGNRYYIERRDPDAWYSRNIAS